MQLLAAEPAMTLVKRESLPVSEGQTIIRSHYLYQPPAVGGVQPDATTVTKELIVVGCGVNYDANRGVGEPNLVPSQAALSPGGVEGVAFESTASPLEVFLPETADLPLIVGKNGRSVSSVIEGAAPAVPHAVDAHTARYENVFEDTDLEWRVGNGYVKESLILRSRKAPTEFTMILDSPDLTFVLPDLSGDTVSYTEIPPGQVAAKCHGQIMIADVVDKDKHRLMIPIAMVCDAGGMEWPMECFVSRSENGSLQYRMRVPESFLTGPNLTFPVIVDPSFIHVTPTGTRPEVYQAGKTYFIDGTIFYGSGESVRIEANAFLKYGPSSQIVFQLGATLGVAGTPYNYAVFTSGYDDSVGVDTDGPGLPLPDCDPGDDDYWSTRAYACALRFYGKNTTEPIGASIRYAKFAFGRGAIAAYPYYGELKDVTVENCVFRDNRMGVVVFDQAYGYNFSGRIHNGLFVAPSDYTAGNELYGVSICYTQLGATHHNIDFQITNCTFTSYDLTAAYGGRCIRIQVYSDEEKQKYLIKRNVFANSDYGITYYDNDDNIDADSDVDYNGFYKCTSANVSPAAFHGSNLIDESADPFETNANGSYYLSATVAGHDNRFLNAGDITAANAGLSNHTTTAPTGVRLVTQNITSSDDWKPIDREGASTVDLGYHYDPVDYIIQPASLPLYVTGQEVALTVPPGLTVAFSHNIVSPLCNSIAAQNGGRLVFVGNGYAPIRFSSTLACGDNIGSGTVCQAVPGLTQLYQGVSVLEAGQGRVEYCTLENAYYSLWVKNEIDPIAGCRFSGGVYGAVDEVDTADPTTVTNCLFRDLAQDAVYSAASGGVHPLSVSNYTFYRTNAGIDFTGLGGERKVHSCIFVENGYGIYAYETPTESHNCFWQNINNANFSTSSTDIVADPRFENAEAPDLYGRFYLNQDDSPCTNTGDPSVMPFMSTATDGFFDVAPVDIGYHYPDHPRHRGAISPRNSITTVTTVVAPDEAHYPRSCQLDDGTILCAYVCGFCADDIQVYASKDYGESWILRSSVSADDIEPRDRSKYCDNLYSPRLIQLHNQSSNPSSNGTVLLAVNYQKDWEPLGGLPTLDAPYATTYTHSIRIFESTDAGTSWVHVSTVREEGPERDEYDRVWTIWEPFLLERSDGAIICLFTREQRDYRVPWAGLPTGYIAALITPDGCQTWDGWNGTTQPIIVALKPQVPGQYDPENPPQPDKIPIRLSYGMAHAVEFPDGVICAVFEAWDFGVWPHSMGIRLSRSTTEGASWQGPEYPVVHDPAGDKWAGCPGIVRLTDNRLVCSFMTDEDSTSQVVAYEWDTDVKAVVSSDWGQNWSPSFVMASQRANKKHCSWQGLTRLHDDRLLCTFLDGPLTSITDPATTAQRGLLLSPMSTVVDLRPAVFTDDFDDGDARNWTLDDDYWWVAGSVFGDGSNWLAGLVYDGNSELAATGVSNWADYEMSADLFFFDFQNYKADEAGIVFHQTGANDYYYFSVHPNWGGKPFCKAERYQSGSPTVLDQEDLNTTLADPITLRMRRMKQGTADKFVCYAGGTSVTFAYDPAGGENVGLRVKAPQGSPGLAVFDNVTVHGANAYLLDAPSELEAPLVEDGFNHLNLDGTPYMWGLLGEHPTLAKKSAWQVVKDDSAHGLVLKGTASTTSSAEAFRGDRGWINDEGETDWMNYSVQADVKLNSASGEAGVCLRVQNYYYGNVYRGDRFYELRLNAEDGEIQFGARRYVPGPPGYWWWQPLGNTAVLENPFGWHTVTVEAVSDDTRTTLTCYLGEDPNPSITATDTSQYQYKDGLVGFWVQNDVALFDSVKVLDLRE